VSHRAELGFCWSDDALVDAASHDDDVTVLVHNDAVRCAVLLAQSVRPCQGRE